MNFLSFYSPLKFCITLTPLIKNNKINFKGRVENRRETKRTLFHLRLVSFEAFNLVTIRTITQRFYSRVNYEPGCLFNNGEWESRENGGS